MFFDWDLLQRKKKEKTEKVDSQWRKLKESSVVLEFEKFDLWQMEQIGFNNTSAFSQAD